MLRADPTSFGEKSLAAYQFLGIKSKSDILPVSSIRKRWNGTIATTDFDGASSILYNPAAGFAEADKALAAVVQASIDRGVEFIVGEMDTLMFGVNKECTGVALKSGQTLTADRVLMCTGAWTESLLAQSHPGNKNLHANGRIVAMGALSFYTKLQGVQRHKFEQVPVFINCLPQVKGEAMSILPDGTAKFNCDMCFTNYVDCAVTGERMSIPPDDAQYNTWTGSVVGDFFRERAKKALQGLYGEEVGSMPVKGYRLCWDAVTPTHDFLITSHPHCQGLSVATGGSFHGWKFLPVIGEYIADMMQGTLGEEYRRRWAWDKTDGDWPSANPSYSVAGDLHDWIS